MRDKLCMTWKSKAERKRIDGIFCFPSFIHLFISLVYIVCVRRKKKRMDFIMMIMIVCVCLCERSRSRPEIKEQEGDICARRFSLFSFSEWEREGPLCCSCESHQGTGGQEISFIQNVYTFFWSETSTVCLFIRFLRLLCCRTFFYYYFSFPTSYCLFKLLDLLSVNWYFLFYSDVMMNYFYLLSESYGLPHFDILFIRRGWDMQQRPSQLVNSIDVRESESLESRVCVAYEGGGRT